MQLTKTLTSVLAAAGLVGTIGLVYAQTTTEPPASPQATTPAAEPAAPATTPSTDTSSPTTPPAAATPSDSTSLPPQQDRN